jgi:hypothetical protein
MTPTIGRVVLYRSKRGIGYQVPAIVTVTPASLVEHPQSELAPLEPDRVHLWVFGPAGGYAEFNVPEGDGEGAWQWPPRAINPADLAGTYSPAARLAIPVTPAPAGRPGPVVELDLEELATLVGRRLKARETLAGPTASVAL